MEIVKKNKEVKLLYPRGVVVITGEISKACEEFSWIYITDKHPKTVDDLAEYRKQVNKDAKNPGFLVLVPKKFREALKEFIDLSLFAVEPTLEVKNNSVNLVYWLRGVKEL